MRDDGIPFGITLLAPAGYDAQLASIGRVFHANTQLTIGSTGLQQPALAALSSDATNDEIAIAVVGAHLSGMALNSELQALGGRLLKATTTAPDYKLFALNGTTPPKPGLLRSSPVPDRRSRLRSGRCRLRRSAPSSPRFHRRCRSAPCGLPTGPASRAFSSKPPRSTAPATSRISAAGALLLRRWRLRCELIGFASQRRVPLTALA
jgi:hypothetical protein